MEHEKQTGGENKKAGFGDLDHLFGLLELDPNSNAPHEILLKVHGNVFSIHTTLTKVKDIINKQEGTRWVINIPFIKGTLQPSYPYSIYKHYNRLRRGCAPGSMLCIDVEDVDELDLS